MQHPAEHATAHVVAALCFFLLLFGLIAVFITHAEKIGRFGLVSFILTFLFIAFYGGLVLGTGAMLPYRIVSIGYGGIGFGAALADCLIWSGRIKLKTIPTPH
jgi:hypothetical protein